MTPRDVLRQRLAMQVHALGPRPMLEAMQEVDAGADIDSVLSRYAGIDGDFVKAIGADSFPPSIWRAA